MGWLKKTIKNVGEAVKDRGLIGGALQLTGISTTEGIKRRQERKNAKTEQIRADTALTYSQAKAIDPGNDPSRTAAGGGAGSDAEDNSLLYLGIGAGVLVVMLVVLVVLVKKRGAKAAPATA